MCTPGAARSSGFGCDREMGDMAYTGEGLTTKTVCANGSKILEFLQFGCGESLAENGEVLALYEVRKSHFEVAGNGSSADLTSIPCPLSVI